jgi:hypothetical protein
MGTTLDLESPEACASFGIAAVDDVRLKCVIMAAISCIIAALIARKIKRSSTDKALFTQPDISYMGECLICFLPHSIDPKKSTLMRCCYKTICNGCCFANVKREFVGGLEHKCVFCREPIARRSRQNVMKRIKKNDPVAMTKMGKTHHREGDYGKALEFYTKAAELGGLDAHCGLGIMYHNGTGVEKNEKKSVYHWEQAPIGGHPEARGLLALHEMDNDRFDRAAKHHIIAANLGCDISLQQVKALFVQGVVSKEEYAAARRGYQTAVDATKSDEREEAEAFFKALDAATRN